MKSPDILLLSPPSRLSMHYRPPLSLMYVANYYKIQGLNVKVLDYPIDRIVRDKQFWLDRNNIIQDITTKMLNEIAYLQAKVIGISCYSTEVEEVKTLINRIKEISHNSPKIIVGGIHPTLCPNEFDNSIQGRLDTGIPAYESVDMDYYSHANPYAIRGVFLRATYILSSFGCPSQCTFCVAKGLMKHYKYVHLKSPNCIYQEVKYVVDTHHIDGFYIIDDLYTSNKQNVIEFCKLIKPLKLLWGCSSKVTFVDEEMIKIMSESGCIQIDFGVERGSDEALKKVKKGITIKQVKEVFKLCKHYRIRTFANFLVALPGETYRDRRDIQQLIENIKPTIVSINHFEPYLGCELYEKGAVKETSKEINVFIKEEMKKSNSIWTNLKFHLSWRYLSTILRSKRKMDYINQLFLLVRELINQKF